MTVADVAEMLTKAGEALVITDGEQVFANPKFCAVAGRSPKEIASDSRAVDFLLPGGRAALARGYDETKALDADQRFHASLLQPDGTALTVAVETIHVRLLPQKTAVLALVRLVEAPTAPPSLLREAFKHVIQNAGLPREKRFDLGRGLAAIAHGSNIADYLRKYAAMGLGVVVETEREGTSISFSAPETIERDAGQTTTCEMTLGFLTGAAEAVWPDASVLGTELTCASRGDAECTFRLRVSVIPKGPLP